MTALSKDRNFRCKPGAHRHRTGGLAADAVCYLGGLAAVDAGGYLVSASDSAAIRVVGLFEEAADNTDGDDGDIVVAYVTGIEVELDNDGGAIGQAQMHSACYVADDASVTTAAAAANDVFCGQVAEFTDEKVWVYIDEGYGMFVPTLADSLDGSDLDTVATAQSAGGVPVVHVIDIADAASGDTDLVITEKTEILSISGFKRGGAGAATNTFTVKNGATAITNAIDGNVADKVVLAPSTIDDAQNVILAGGTLRVSHTKAGGDSSARFTFIGIKRA